MFIHEGWGRCAIKLTKGGYGVCVHVCLDVRWASELNVFLIFPFFIAYIYLYFHFRLKWSIQIESDDKENVRLHIT